MRSLERALDVLAVLEHRSRPLRLTEVAADAQLHVATVQRILGVLERRGLVSKEDGRYQLGVATVPMAHAFLIGNPLSRAATPVLQELAATTGLTASLFVRDGWDRVVIGRVQGANPLRYELPIGDRLPLHVGAGRIMAAAMSAEELDALLHRVGEIRLASGASVDREEYVESLRQIRRDGYHIARSERVLGVSSVAAPIRQADGHIAGVVIVSGSDDDMTPEVIDRLIVEVRQAATAIGVRTQHL